MTQQLFNPGPSSLRTARMLSYRIPRPTTSFPGPSPSKSTKLGLGVPRLGRAEGGLAERLQTLDKLQNAEEASGDTDKEVYNDNVQPDYQIGSGVKGGMVQGHANAFQTPRPDYDYLAAPPHQTDLAQGGRVARQIGGQIPDSPRAPFTGPIATSGSGRADNVPMHVPSGAYVLPADVVSHIGQGNSLQGFKILNMMYGPKPFGANAGPWGVPMPKGAQGRGPQAPVMPRVRPRAPMPPAVGMPKPTPAGPTKHGGVVPGQESATPIAASGGEYVISPGEVKRRGGGDINAGHKYLDAFVKMIRADHIKTLKGLPGPAQ